MSKPLLTIGMATLDDFDGVYFTVTSLMLHHAKIMRDCEIVVVDNNPYSKHGKLVKDWILKRVPNGSYFPYDASTGTAQSRNEVFRHARGESVLCIDCHVLLVPGAIQKLIDYFQKNPECRDLLSGPLLSDCGVLAATHQRPQWSNGAWGVWSVDERGRDPEGEPFEIWQQGMGLFSCRKDAWVGFHPEFRGFGGCETYIMEKFRKNGSRVLCCPWLRWTHRFQRPEGVPYRVKYEDRIRNYIVGFQDLGLDAEPVLKHFKVPQDRSVGLTSSKPASEKTENFAVVGDSAFGGVEMRGRVLSNYLSCKLVTPKQIQRMARRKTIITIKDGFCPTTIREKCDRLIYDPLDVFCSTSTDVAPVDYWQSQFQKIKFDELIATSPACHEVMREAVPDHVCVHLVPHQCDSRIEKNWHNPDGPIVYSGLKCFIESGLDRIQNACRIIGKKFLIGDSCDVLKGASLALALRLPPFNTALNRYCKPQIKLANAAAAGLPVVSTECPAATSLYPELPTVPVNFTVSGLADVMQRALEGPGLTNPYGNGHYIKAMDRIIHRETVVVYTAIFGGYDSLKEPRDQMPGVKFVCFTDNPRLKSKVWNIHYCRPTGDPLMQAKSFKILAHEVLDCDISLWIDGRVELHNLNGAINQLSTDLALHRHEQRNCIYQEASHCITVKRGDPRQIEDAIARYKSEGHPPHYGLWRGGVILRRHSPCTTAFNREWWREVSVGTTRDQIVLPVVLRRLGIPFETFTKDVPLHRIGNHLK
ncbi:glycosyltransferase domain-containing protein [Gimesia algae]|uniref:Glycosyl transferase family 2 n=1 Tax=Gimesia algae TaxID=2527971 RepID=A0A517VF41_9PLAN|nr:glycosyltransferase domain-containing protein [Gimesia algae]QDT91635.1 Glycosyl transferase family 2 [Gimesia algae]